MYTSSSTKKLLKKNENTKIREQKITVKTFFDAQPSDSRNNKTTIIIKIIVDNKVKQEK